MPDFSQRENYVMKWRLQKSCNRQLNQLKTCRVWSKTLVTKLLKTVTYKKLPRFLPRCREICRLVKCLKCSNTTLFVITPRLRRLIPKRRVSRKRKRRKRKERRRNPPSLYLTGPRNFQPLSKRFHKSRDYSKMLRSFSSNKTSNSPQRKNWPDL